MKLPTLAACGVILVVLSVSAQEPAPWPAPEVCNEELLADYRLREELISDLMMDLQECRLRYGGCAPGSTWLLEEINRRWLAEHPEIERREREEREAWHREMERELEAEEQREPEAEER